MRTLITALVCLFAAPAFSQALWRNFFTTNQNPIVEVVAGSNATVQASTVGANLRRFVVNGMPGTGGSGPSNLLENFFTTNQEPNTISNQYNASLILTQAVELDKMRLLTYRVGTLGEAPFSLSAHSSANGGGGAGTYNHNISYGWNGARHGDMGTTPGKHAILMGMEDGFFDTLGDGKLGAEWYVEGWSPDGTTIQNSRPFYARGWQDNSGTNWWTITHDIGTLGLDRGFYVRMGTSNLFVIQEGGVTFTQPLFMFGGGSVQSGETFYAPHVVLSGTGITPLLEMGASQYGFSTYMNGESLIIHSAYAGGQWDRSLMQFEDATSTPYFKIGAYGSGQTMTYAYIGPAYNSNWIVLDQIGVGVGLLGTNTPQTKFQVGSPHYLESIGVIPTVRIISDYPLDTSSKTLLRLNRPLNYGLYYSGSVDFNLRSAGAGLAPETTMDIALKSAASTNGTADVVVMTLKSDGKVGIGNTNPATALQVNGIATATSFAGASITNWQSASGGLLPAPTNQPSAGTVLSATSASTAAWAAPTGGAGATVNLLDCSTGLVQTVLSTRTAYVFMKSNATYNAEIVANGVTNTIYGALTWVDVQPYATTNWFVRY